MFSFQRLESCFEHSVCLNSLLKLNLLDRIKNKQVLGDVSRHLQKKLSRYEQSDDILDIFK